MLGQTSTNLPSKRWGHPSHAGYACNKNTSGTRTRDNVGISQLFGCSVVETLYPWACTCCILCTARRRRPQYDHAIHAPQIVVLYVRCLQTLMMWRNSTTAASHLSCFPTPIERPIRQMREYFPHDADRRRPPLCAQKTWEARFHKGRDGFQNWKTLKQHGNIT